MSIPDFEINPHKLTPLLATPRTLAMIFAGAATYVGFVDPKVRQQLQGTKYKLQHWTSMYLKSRWPLFGLSLTSAISSAICYYVAKQKFWLIGAGLMLSLWPFNLLFMMQTSKNLNDFNENLQTRASGGTAEQNSKIETLMQSWVSRHHVKTVFSLIAIAIFYVAEKNSTQNLNLSVKIR